MKSLWKDKQSYTPVSRDVSRVELGPAGRLALVLRGTACAMSSPFSRSVMCRLDELCSPSRSAITRSGANPVVLSVSGLGRLLLVDERSFSVENSTMVGGWLLVGDMDLLPSRLVVAARGRIDVSPLPGKGPNVIRELAFTTTWCCTFITRERKMGAAIEAGSSRRIGSRRGWWPGRRGRLWAGQRRIKDGRNCLR